MIRTDLALEAREMCQENEKSKIPGVKVEQEEGDIATITHVKVINEQGSKIMNKPIGSYITIEAPKLKKADADLKDEMSDLLAQQIKEFAPEKKHFKTLIVGLGNWDITPDALGPQVVSKIYVTRHYFETYKKEEDDSMRSVSAISPGVMGTTGIETVDIVKGIVQKTQPDFVICIDALASRKVSRVNTTIQITDTGISPGGGVGNKRKEFSKNTLGVPVLAIGIPTVVDAATLANDTINLVVDHLAEQSSKESAFYNLLKGMEDSDKYNLIKEIMAPFDANVIVTTKDIDMIITNISQIVANAINIALHPGIKIHDVNRYLH